MAGENTKIYIEQGGARMALLPGAALVIGDWTFTVNDDGDIIVTGMPTSEPAAVGALYSSSGVLTIGNGP